MDNVSGRGGSRAREAASDSRPLGVVIERRAIDNPWKDYAWSAVGVTTDAIDGTGWRDLDEGDGWKRFLVSGFALNLYSGETEGYKVNLSQPVPSVYVVLRPGEEAEDHDVEPFAVTACPYEAMGYAESGDEQVDAVAMPTELIAWVGSFVEAHHVDEPFRKRKRGSKNPKDAPSSRPRGRRGKWDA